MRRIFLYFFFIFVAGVFTSCSSNKHIIRTDDIQAFTAHCNIKITENNNSTSLSGSLRFRKDDVIQILFTPIFGIEAARLEISPDNVLFIDRMNKQFVQTSYNELRKMSGIKLNYKNIQSLFLHFLTLSNEDVLSEQNIMLPLNDHLKLDLQLTNFTKQNEWSGHSSVSDKYQQIEMEGLLKLLRRVP